MPIDLAVFGSALRDDFQNSDTGISTSKVLAH